MAYETNRFCWHGIHTNDPAAAAKFYPAVLGWESLSTATGDNEAAMFTAGSVPIAHYMAPPSKDAHSHWSNYLRVDDVDASTRAAVENGGAEVVPPTDIPVGRFSFVTSPSGAHIGLFHEANEEISQHHPGGTGSIHWTELQSKDLDADMAWLESTFGFEVGEMPMPDGGTYYILKSGGQPRGGAMASNMERAPSMWLTWVRVDDCDEANQRVEANGGKVMTPPIDMPSAGRMSVVSDSTGAVFGVIQPVKKD